MVRVGKRVLGRAPIRGVGLVRGELSSVVSCPFFLLLNLKEHHCKNVKEFIGAKSSSRIVQNRAMVSGPQEELEGVAFIRCMRMETQFSK